MKARCTPYVVAASLLQLMSLQAWADNINVVVRSWDSTNKQVVSEIEQHDCTDMSDWSDAANNPTMDAQGGERWFYFSKNTTYNNRPLVATGNGTVHLVIPDGVTLTLNQGLKAVKDTQMVLHIHSQAGDGGKLVASNSNDYETGIGGQDNQSSAHIIIHGGNITAQGGKFAAGIGGSRSIHKHNCVPSATVDILGGTVSACGGKMGAGIGCGRLAYEVKEDTQINIYGGTITAQGGGYAAGIGYGKTTPDALGYKENLKINILGGTVNATGGEDGAGIGVGEAAVTIGNTAMSENTSYSKICIGGNAVVRAVGTSYGAGIGGGDDTQGCNVVVEGNARVTAIAGNDCKTGERYGGSAIGAGDADGWSSYGDKNKVSGELTLADNMRVVSALAESEAGAPSGTLGRVADCRWHNFCRIEPCDHTGATFTYTLDTQNEVSATYHEKHCSYCALATKENHTYTDGTCVCGKQSTSGQTGVSTVTIYEAKDARSGEYGSGMELHVVNGRTFTVPNSRVEGLTFMGWAKNPVSATDDYEMADDEFTALVDPGTTLTIDSNVSLYARYRYEYDDEWTWAADYRSASVKVTWKKDDSTSESGPLTPQEADSGEDNITYTCTFTYHPTGKESTTTYNITDFADATGIADISLADNSDNTETISSNLRSVAHVTLQERTLFKDGSWNTLCLPFSASTDDESSPLYGATVMEMNSSSGFADGILTLNFSETDVLEAGVPYLVKWSDTSSTIDAPVFRNAYIDDKTTDGQSTRSNDGFVTFIGSYSPVNIAANDKSVLYLGSDNKVYWPTEAMNIGSCRARFVLNGITAGDQAQEVRSIRLNLGDDATTAITSASVAELPDADGSWYDLSGRKLSGSPKARGIYIHNGRKVANR